MNSFFWSIFLLITIRSVSCNDLPYKNAPPVEWVRTDYSVALGQMDVSMTLKIYDVCKIIHEYEQNATTILIKEAYKRFSRRCDQTRDEYYEPKLLEIKKISDEQLQRTKRFIDPVSLTVIGLALYSLTATGVGATLWYAHPDSPHNTIPPLQDAVTELTKNVTALDTKTITAGNSSFTVEEWIRLQFDKNIKVDSNLSDVALTAADMSWMGPDLYAKIKDYSELLDTIRRNYNTDEVDVYSISRLSGNKALSNIRYKRARWIGISLLGRSPDTILLRFSLILVSQDTFILNAKPFNTYMESPEDVVPLEYAGPKFIVYNSTNNCSGAIEEPKGMVIGYLCSVPNGTLGYDKDPKPGLQDWKPINHLYFNRTQTMAVNGRIRVDCFPGNFSIDETTYKCPPGAIEITKEGTVRIGDLTFTSTNMNITQYSTPKSPYRPETLNTSLEMDQILIKQKYLQDKLKLNNDYWKTLALPGKSVILTKSSSGWSVLTSIIICGVIACCIALLFCVGWLCFYVRRTKTAAAAASGRANNVHVDVHVENQGADAARDMAKLMMMVLQRERPSAPPLYPVASLEAGTLPAMIESHPTIEIVD